MLESLIWAAVGGSYERDDGALFAVERHRLTGEYRLVRSGFTMEENDG